MSVPNTIPLSISALIAANSINPSISERPYGIEVDIIDDYMRMSTHFIQKVHGVKYNTSIDILNDLIRKQGEDPLVEYWSTSDKGDKTRQYIKLTEYVKQTYARNQTLAPSLTTYAPISGTGSEVSLHRKFTLNNLAKRSVAKKAAATAYTDANLAIKKMEVSGKSPELEEYVAKKFFEANELTNKQKVLKLLNNAMSGAFTSQGTIHYNPSAHYSLTSTTRAVASIGNICTEMVSGGNRFYSTLDRTMEHIVSTVLYIDTKLYAEMLSEFDIIIPSVNDLMSMIRYSTINYWDSDSDDNIIRKYLSTLNPIERCKVMYNNDFYHFDKLNPDLCKTMIGEIARKVMTGVPNELAGEYINSQNSHIRNLTVHICMDDMIGQKIDINEMAGKPIIEEIASTMQNINKMYNRYGSILKSILSGRILPVGGANTKELVRRVIVLSDTDSTCGSYNHWVVRHLGEENYDAPGVGISATMMTMVGMSIENSINCFTGNMNVADDSRGLLEMKNEYFWKTFAVGRATKHYYAMVNIIEGVVLNPNDRKKDLEIKGKNFIESKTPYKFRKYRDTMMRLLNKEVTRKHPINVRKYINRVLVVEKHLEARANAGDVDILGAVTIKGKKNYKMPHSSNYQSHVLWNEVFAPKYGHQNEPPYVAVKYSLDMKRKKDTIHFIDGIQDEELKERMIAYMAKWGKDKITTIYFPHDKVLEHGIPQEVQHSLKARNTIRGACKPMYWVLATIGVNMRDDQTLIDMGYTLPTSQNK